MRALSDATAGMLKPVALSPRDRLVIDVDDAVALKNFVVRITGDTPAWFPSNVARSMWLGRVPERRQIDGTNRWLLAATDYTAEIIKALWPPGQVVWASEAAETLFDYLLLTTSQQDASAEAYARFKLALASRLREHTAAAEAGATGEELEALLGRHDALMRAALPDGAGDLLVHPDVPLSPYQTCALWLAMRSEGYGYFMEQGTGKTPLVVSEICNLAARGASWQRPVRALIVPPKNVRVNWLHEFERFSTVPGRVEIVKGGEVKRATSLVQALVPEEGCLFTVVVMSYESMVRSLDDMRIIMDGMGIERWDLAALDESHFIMRPETQRSRAAIRLRDMAERRRVLTGTPVCNTPLDLYAQFEFMGEGWSGFRSWQSFRSFYGVFEDVEGDGHQKLVGVQNLPFMKERLARTSFIVSLREALPDLPERVFDTDEVEMTAAQTETYERVARQMIEEIEEELEASDNKTMTVNNVLTKLLRLAQVAHGYVTWDAVHNPHSLELVRGRSVEWFNPDPKLERLVEVLKAKGPREKTIVWSCFVPCIERISERLELEGMEHVTFYGSTSDAARAEAERRFNCERECRVLVGNPAAGGAGLNLLGYPPHAGEGYETDAGHTIYYAQDWSYTKRSQSGARNHRKGTRVHVRETDLVVPDTIDEEIRIRVLKKKMVAMEIADIREILGAVLRGISA